MRTDSSETGTKGADWERCPPSSAVWKRRWSHGRSGVPVSATAITQWWSIKFLVLGEKRAAEPLPWLPGGQSSGCPRKSSERSLGNGFQVCWAHGGWSLFEPPLQTPLTPPWPLSFTCAGLQDHDLGSGELPADFELTRDLLLQPDVRRSPGPHRTRPRVLKEQADVTARPSAISQWEFLGNLERSQLTGSVPTLFSLSARVRKTTLAITGSKTNTGS